MNFTINYDISQNKVIVNAKQNTQTFTGVSFGETFI